MYINNTELIEHVKLCDVEENNEFEKDRGKISCLYGQKLIRNSKEIMKHMEVH